MRAVALVGLLILSSFGTVAAWQPQTQNGETIGLLNGNVDSIPIDQVPQIPQYGFWMLTREYPVPSTWVHDLADAGVECWSFLPQSAFHCELSGHTPAELERLEVNGMIKMPPSAKLHPDLLPSLEGKMTSWMMTKGFGMVSVVLSGDELPEDIHHRGDVEVLYHNYRWATLEVRTSGVHWLSQQSEIEWIEPKFERILYNDVADGVIAADVLRNATRMAAINSAWNALDGTGIIVAVSDTGLDNGVNNTNMHPDFKDHIVGIHSYGIPSGAQSWVNAPYNDGASDLDSGHGTHVAGSVLGDGTQSSGAITGIAPEARLYMQATEVYTDWTTAAENNFGYTDDYTLMGIPDDLSTMFDDAAANGSHVHTNSWGAPVAGQYNTNSMQADHSARNHSGMLILFAAGNSGVDSNSDGEIDDDSIGSPATSKNVLTVGASENDRGTQISSEWGQWWPADFPQDPINSDKMANNTQGMAAFSSRGPVDDGRLKPDISAPGTFILSTKSRSTTQTGWLAHSNTDYTYMGGTSMATPLTAGAAALLYQHLDNNLGHSDPTSSLLKAIIAASASDMTGQYGSSTNGAGEATPNYHEGWGLLDLDRAVNTSWVDNESVNTGDSRAWKFTVPSSAPDLRIAVAWTDPASTPTASVNLVNDIDFAVKDPSGNWVEYGNNLDNLIGTKISSPAAGQWEIHVNGTNIPNGPQHFAMVIDAPYSMINLSADADGDGFIDTLDDCPNTSGTSTQDKTGCPDGDGDGWSNVGDEFPNEGTQWADADSDGFGDNPGGINPDSCTSVVGTSSSDRYGCPDSDSDSWSDPDGGWTAIQGADACPSTWGNSTLDRNGCLDGDGDGQSDLNDALLNDDTQWLDTDGDGYYDNANPATDWDDCPTVWGNSTVDLQGCLDTDGDGVSDTNDPWPNDPTRSIDTDGDGFADSDDDCPTVWGNSTQIVQGCLDADGDGWTANDDAFPNDGTQWNDTDGDGFGDEPTGNYADDCPTTFGDSWQNGTLGCPDADGDGWSDSEDSFDNDQTQWKDSDGDGFGDNIGGTNPDTCPTEAGNSTQGGILGCPDADGDGWADSADAFPTDDTQYSDQDGDGYGDNITGNSPDSCPLTYGNSTIDRLGCVDTDGDGHSDLNDDFPNDPTRYLDTDNDGYDDAEDDCPTSPGTSTNGALGCFDADQDSWADSNDSFPMDASQWNDTDMDGYGDNATGTNPDACPTTFGNSTSGLLGCLDSDGDTWDDVTDLFPSDGTEWADNDSDGFGNNIDSCPETPGNASNGSIGCIDTDGDTWADNSDFLPQDSSQWLDTDGDGYGDNLAGTDGDNCPNDEGYAFLDLIGCPDDDQDGWSNQGDAFPDRRTQYQDTDGDGFGDNNSPGAELADHWPDDPTRNTAEVILTCDPQDFEIDIALDSSIRFECYVTNLIQNDLTVRIEWKAINAIDAGIRTAVFVIPPNETKPIAFTGYITEKGQINSVIEASEPGAESSMAFTSLNIKAINSQDGDSFDDLLDKAKEVSHLQEIIAVGVAMLLALFLAFNARRNSRKKKEERRRHLQQRMASVFTMDEGNRPGRFPPN